MSRKSISKRLLLYRQQTVNLSADTAACRWRRLYAQSERAQWPPPGGGGTPCPRRGGKRGQGHQMVPLPPLDSPKPSFALTHRRCAAKRELRGLGSGRRFAFGTLSGPEFTLRGLPRITVRGQTVQGGSVPLRKAPLPSIVYPWSSKRPCGPLAFRRATGGSRVLRKGRGVKRGRETLVSLPLLFLPVNTGIPRRRRRPLCTLTSSVKSPPPAAPLYRRNRVPSAEGKENFQILLDKGRGV